MIYEYPPNIYNKLKKLKGYIHTKTVNKYITKNKKIIKMVKNPNYFLFFLILFCGSLFIFHLYTLWLKYKNGEKEEIIIKL